MTPRGRRALRIALAIVVAIPVLLFIAGWIALAASLPALDGSVVLAGLSGPVMVERDAVGVPVIRGATREDVARATGFVHGQDRFFQMDLLRRTAAGELAELLGPALADTDEKLRLHQFRQRARAALGRLDARERSLLEAYAAGVNAALAGLRGRPFEYLLLRQQPLPWRPEDTVLVVYAMWIDLQGLSDRDEQQNDRLASSLPPPLYRLLTEPDPDWEAPIDGSRLPQPPLPDATEVDLRQLEPSLFREPPDAAAIVRIDDGPAPIVGSNNWAIAGARSADGGALVANDMHLGLHVPNIWYRARLVVAGGVDVSGVSLPGVPAIVAGSNGHVAWGFTNSYGDFQDLVVLEPEGEGYRTPDGPRPFETERELIHVAGAADRTLEVRKTLWGPVIGKDAAGRELTLAWTAHHVEAVDLRLLALEDATDLDSAAGIIGGAGMPAQNVVIADSSGRIGWVLSGRLPRRAAFDPKRPSDWTAPGSGWQGWIPPAESPRLLDPPDDIAWSANARVVGGERFALIGDGDYAAAARSHQIRARLAALPRATPADLLAIQTDDRADYVGAWLPLAERAFADAGRSDAARLVRGWSGHAAVNDAGYRLLREFERHVSDRAYRMLTEAARRRWPDFRWRTPQRFTEVAWRLVKERPENLLDPNFDHWEAWLADVAREVADHLPAECVDLASCRWGKVNIPLIQHPISEGLPFLSRWLDMPRHALPGDWSMPRVQAPTFGASERFGVSPGRERAGYLHMPGGQSGNPLSPYYRDGHEAWVRGEATPFLPGPAAHVLKLVPR